MPVNPRRESVQGLPCYASVNDLPETPDAALIAVPAKLVPETIDALGRKGCRAATLFSAGFAETGNEGEAAQRDLAAKARGLGMRLLGPNTLGVYNVDIGYFGTFSSSLDTGHPLPGNIGIASQSGAFGAISVHWRGSRPGLFGPDHNWERGRYQRRRGDPVDGRQPEHRCDLHLYGGGE